MLTCTRNIYAIWHIAYYGRLMYLNFNCCLGGACSGCTTTIKKGVVELFMKHTFKRIPSPFFRISLQSDTDVMTLALVPDMDQAHLIGRMLTDHYGLRKGEKIVILPSVFRPCETVDTIGTRSSAVET
jgi:hypothetical protein